LPTGPRTRIPLALPARWTRRVTAKCPRIISREPPTSDHKERSSAPPAPLQALNSPFANSAVRLGRRLRRPYTSTQTVRSGIPASHVPFSAVILNRSISPRRRNQIFRVLQFAIKLIGSRGRMLWE